MDIRNIQQTATVTFEIDRGEKPAIPVTFTVGYVSLDSIRDHFPPVERNAKGEPKRPRLSEVRTSMLIEAVQSWDLTEDRQPLECNQATKEKWLPLILGLPIKAKEGEGDPFSNVLGLALLNFAGDAENFFRG